MKVKHFLSNNANYDLEDIKDFLEGLGNYEDTRSAMCKAIGVELATIDICTDEDYTDIELLNAEIVENPDYVMYLN
jgi:hypothetical protein